jgi:hypothetical protein
LQTKLNIDAITDSVLSHSFHDIASSFSQKQTDRLVQKCAYSSHGVVSGVFQNAAEAAPAKPFPRFAKMLLSDLNQSFLQRLQGLV